MDLYLVSFLQDNQRSNFYILSNILSFKQILFNYQKKIENFKKKIYTKANFFLID